MATVAKNFRIKSGLVVEGSTGTINGQNILTETGGDTYILNLVGGATLVKSVSSDFAVDGSGNLTINGSSDLARTGDITTAVNNLDTDDIEEGGSNLYFTNQRALDATSAAYEAAGSVTSAINALDTDDIEEGVTNQYFTNQRALDATSSAYDAYGAAATAQSNAEDYADGLASNYDAAGTAAGLVDDLKDGTTAFTEINVNSEAKQIAATSSSLGSVVVTAYEWPKSAYRSGKFLVKIDNATHNEISEILVTLDSSDNVAITEYAIVGTNGSRGTVTADVSGSNVRIRVNPVNDSTIKVTGTLLK